MAPDWVMLPIEQLVRKHPPLGGNTLTVQQCALCGDRTTPAPDQTTAEQIRIHLERHHEAVAETQTERPSARLRKKLTRAGWTPPADAEPDQPDPSRLLTPPPETPDEKGRGHRER